MSEHSPKLSKTYPFRCSLNDSDNLDLSHSNNKGLIRVTANTDTDSVDIYLDKTQIGMLISALATMRDQLT